MSLELVSTDELITELGLTGAPGKILKLPSIEEYDDENDAATA